MSEQKPTVRWRDDPKEYCRQYATLHRSELNEMSKLWAARNKEKRRAIRLRYEASHAQELKSKAAEKYAANKAVYSERGRAYIQKNLQKRREYERRYRQVNKERIRNYAKAKRGTEQSKIYFRLYQHRRRAKIKNSQKDQSSVLKALYEQAKNKIWTRCYYCGKRIRGRDSHLDHILPIIKGGPHSSDNLCISCPKCNLSKNDKLVNEWQGTKQLHLL